MRSSVRVIILDLFNPSKLPLPCQGEESRVKRCINMLDLFVFLLLFSTNISFPERGVSARQY